MKTALVTGSAGFIGFHLSEHLLNRGYRVVGIDGMTSYYDIRLKHARLERLSRNANYSHHTLMLEDASAIRETFEAANPALVYHLAAQAGVRYSIENPGAYITANIQGTFNVMEAIKELQVEHLLFASTSSVYGGNTKLPFAEGDRADSPVSLYAATKKAGEALLHSYSHLWKIPVTAFRFFTVYGPWGRPDMALFKFAEAIAAGREIDVYGYGKMSRDFTYVDDLVRAIGELTAHPPVEGEPVGSYDSLSAVAPFRTVNIGGGNPTPLGEFIGAVELAMGVTAEQNLLPMQPGDVQVTSADPELLRALIGETPSTPINEGVARFIAWLEDWNRSGVAR